MYHENFNHSIIQTVSQLPKANLSITRLGIVLENTVMWSRGTFEFHSGQPFRSQFVQYHPDIG